MRQSGMPRSRVYQMGQTQLHDAPQALDDRVLNQVKN